MSTPALRSAPRRSALRRVATTRLAVACAALSAAGLACRAAASESKTSASTTTTAATSGATQTGTDRPGPDSLALRAAADSGRIQGSPSAKVWLIEISDFQCPYCKMWHDDAYETLRREYIETGKARAAYMNFPLDMHVQSHAAAEAAMCASAQHRFWEYHSALFRTQQQWGRPGDQSPIFDSLATSVGVDAGKFRSCTRSHVMRATVDADMDRMERAGVRSTPTFYVGNKQISGAQPVAVFRAALDAAIANPPAIPSSR